MDDLDKAILISFDESGAVDSALKAQAVAYCQQFKENPSICSICIERLCFSKLVQVQFWCLQCLHEVLRVRYSSMGPEEKSFIRKSVFSLGCYESIDDKNLVRLLDGPAFIKNKLSQVMVTLVYFEYPMIWPSVFVDFLSNLSKGVVVIDMFCRVLNALDDEVISMDYPRSQEEVAVSGRIKDAMRQQCISQVVRAWYDILLMYRNSDPDLCCSVLDSMRRYVSWIDIGLIANDTFVGLLFELTLASGFRDQLRGAAAGCIHAVAAKRMDPKAKLTLLQSLQIRRVFSLVAEDNDSELVSSVASLLTGYSTEVLECLKRLNSEDGKAVSTELLNEVLPSVFYVMQNCEIDETFSIVQFLSGYVGTLKSLVPLTETQSHHVGQILEVIRTQIRFDPAYRNNLDVLDKIGREEEDRMAEFRKELFVLLRSVGRVAPDATQIFIRNSLASAVASNGDVDVEEIEAALSLLYAFGESLTDETMKTGNGLLGELIPMLLSTKFPCHNNRLVALIYLETITRYMKFFQENTQYIPLVLSAFLDERGIHHPNSNVNRRASYLFMRVVKLLKAKLVPYLETILQSLQDTVAQFTTIYASSKELSGCEDGSHIFEAIGLLIGMEDVPLEKQSEFLSALLTPLCQQVEALLLNAKAQNPEESPAKIANIQQIIMAINALSKGFSERLVTASRPAIGLMFKQTLDVLLRILIIFPKIEPLRCKVTSFIHRMVDILGSSVFPYLPKALEQLLAESEEIRELQELQRTFYTFLHVIATHDLSSAFLSSKSRVYLDPMMQLVLHASCNHKDIVVRKACVQIFIKLIKDWCARPYGEEKVPGFQSFVIEAFATNCCLYSVLDKSFEFRDANTLVLFGEIVMAQKVMYEKFGNDFLVHFVSKGFPSAHCPQDLAEQYCQKLQGNDIKVLKSFYQSLIENLRRQQNGSLVFR
ncbi:exportin-T isoform X2 [Nicotiana tomentosiformis]|uniref:exportin-T isoform X2 n=1 Tax=Nicotiana tomentosiformis TaxID=4098 RepID=UPI00051C5DA5